MEKYENDEGDGENRRAAPRAAGLGIVMLLGILLMVGTMFFIQQDRDVTQIPLSFFEEQLEAKNIQAVTIGQTTASGFFKAKPPLPPRLNAKGELEPQKDSKTGKPLQSSIKFTVNLDPARKTNPAFEELLRRSGAIVENAPYSDPSVSLFVVTIVVSIGLFFLVLWFMRRSQAQMMGGGFFSGFGRSPAKRYEASRQAVTFKDVAGVEGVKADLQEIVEFLKTPKKFQRLGGRVPKGVLLNGPPGTGKTLLARAVAGEAGVPFYSVNGSEFIQMFVGVGASRVRDLFKNAKENSPAIIFIDEIDAVGRQRGAGLGGGHDEREQTLNQILSEMDGFNQTDFVIVMGATNRPDVLDPALLRPGRFDRHVTVGKPTQRARVEIFKVHTRDVPLGDDVDLNVLASLTIGLTGADIRNIVNEAALWAARYDKNKVEMADFDYARDKTLIGPKREEVLQAKEKEKTAYHEAGHTILAWVLPGANRVHKVTIVPRGMTLGTTQMLPSEDRMSMAESELRDQLVVLLAGRAAEMLIYGEGTIGAQNDLERATAIARHMVTSWGMSEQMGPVSFKMSDDDPFLGREIHQQRQFSEATMERIDEEIGRILREAADRANKVLSDNREKLEQLTRRLIEKEELDDEDITLVLGPSIQSRSGSPERGEPAEVPRSAT
ncbi:ATP-dependent zinc metalloprotease FtsH [Anatilimnocola aggregata]|uniref:ATP-dependent zinc metalloprotease FtsH n=1 Tax=Anatilimnocola aggregata TaxID=2528021 RepID=A0A517YNQ3_9BACT|nr:ATP-dependent zinc metalloprotease FtsH [Anatilimnocola aggregata]QDU31840.1 ATP-dependent zinc metalloprotease FtsH [Anatilimnocola aggregata]